MGPEFLTIVKDEDLEIKKPEFSSSHSQKLLQYMHSEPLMSAEFQDLVVNYAEYLDKLDLNIHKIKN